MTPTAALSAAIAIVVFVAVVRLALWLVTSAIDRRVARSRAFSRLGRLAGDAAPHPEHCPCEPCIAARWDRLPSWAHPSPVHPFPPAAAPRPSVWSGARSEPPRDRVHLLAAAVIVGAAASLAYCAVADASPCGEERAAVKLGLDADARAVNTRPVDVSIAELTSLPRPRAISPTRRAAPVELTVYRITGTITAVKHESDGDYHLVIADDAGHHLIVEVPDPSCAAGGPWGKEIEAARDAAEHWLHPGARVRRVAVRAVIVGVGFFDKVHGQLGVWKPTGIELHPVIGLEIGGGA